jgi:hypothetical protein
VLELKTFEKASEGSGRGVSGGRSEGGADDEGVGVVRERMVAFDETRKSSCYHGVVGGPPEDVKISYLQSPSC